MYREVDEVYCDVATMLYSVNMSYLTSPQYDVKYSIGKLKYAVTSLEPS